MKVYNNPAHALLTATDFYLPSLRYFIQRAVCPSSESVVPLVMAYDCKRHHNHDNRFEKGWIVTFHKQPNNTWRPVSLLFTRCHSTLTPASAAVLVADAQRVNNVPDNPSYVDAANRLSCDGRLVRI